MGIDLVVTSLADEWAQYADSAVALGASLERLVPFGVPRPPYDRDLAQRASLEASPAEERAGAARVAEAVRSFQHSLSSRFALEISWTDPVGMEEIFWQINPYASSELSRSAGCSAGPTSAVRIERRPVREITEIGKVMGYEQGIEQGAVILVSG